VNYIVQHQRTVNDTYGNPRRLWVIYRDSAPHPTRYAHIHRVIDEGYAISTAGQAMKEAGLEEDPYLMLPDVDITPAQYREGLRIAERIDSTNPWRVRWVDDQGDETQIYCYAANRSRARRFARTATPTDPCGCWPNRTFESG
jgi:hypothetical protein